MRTILWIIIGSIFMSTNIAYGQISDASKKIVKANAKQFEKEGWVLDGTGTFLSVLTDHRSKIEGGKATELVGNANNKKSVSLAKAIARNNAINEYAENACSMVRAKINTDLKDLNEEQRENFTAVYERLFNKEMTGILKSSFYMYRRNVDGTYDLRAFFIVDEESITTANKNAIQETADQTGISKQYAKEVAHMVGYSK